VGSRRECEELIQAGRVEIDGETVSELGTRVDPTRQRVRVDGVMLPRPKRVYFVVNKPVGVVCTNRDPSGRPRVIDLVRSDERLFAVGRLDRTSEGLILVTNDGELSNRLTHPRYGVDKTYRARVAGYPPPRLLDKLRRGIHLSDGVARVAAVRVKHRHKDSTDLEIVLDEGRNREIRRLLARIGHKVLSLKRTAMGPLNLADLPVGACRRLTTEEVRRLKEASRRRKLETERATRPANPPRRRSERTPTAPMTQAEQPDWDVAPVGSSPPANSGRRGAVLTYDNRPGRAAPLRTGPAARTGRRRVRARKPARKRRG